MDLKTAGMTFGDFELGAPDAEADRKLSSYFVRTPYVEAAIRLRRGLFLGRKGSGKSALFTQLPRLIEESGFKSTHVISVTPDQYAWSTLQQYTETGLQPEQAHANAWKFTIALEIAISLASIQDISSFSEKSKQSIENLRKFIEQNYGEVPQPQNNKTFSAAKHAKSTIQFLKGIKSFNISAFGFGAGLSREANKESSTPYVIDSIMESIENICREIGVVVCLDKLDDSWDGGEKSKQLLIGLLKASKDINDRLRESSPKTGAAVIVFLRSDIYEGLQFDDKDKHRATEESIIWTPELLKEMMNERLPSGVRVDDLFEPGEMRGSIQPFNYIVKRTFLRPREVIQYMQECIRRAGPQATLITKNQIRDAEDKYSSWKVEDLKQEYRRLYPDFDNILESLRQGKHRYDTFEELNKHLKSQIPNLIEKHGDRKIVELLFNASAIGVRLGDSGSPKFRSEDSDLILPTSGAIYVHQCLYRGLSLREKRSRDGGVNEDELGV